MKKVLASILLTSSLFLSGCDSDADIASRNISQAADMFEVDRRVVFYNGITGDYILSVEGRCSLGNSDTDKRMTVTCKTGPGMFKKHFLGLSNNVTFFAEQLESKGASVYHYRVIFKPQSIIPDINITGDIRQIPVPTVKVPSGQ